MRADIVKYSLKVPLFITVSVFKSLCDAGAVFLTMNKTVETLNKQFTRQQTLSPAMRGVDIGLQGFAVTLSQLVVILSRYPKNWKRLDATYIAGKFEEINKEAGQLQSSATVKYTYLSSIALLGLLICGGRGIQAYVGMEVVLNNKLGFEGLGVIIANSMAAIAVASTAFCFYWPDMMTSASKWLKRYEDMQVSPTCGEVFNTNTLLSSATVVTYVFVMRFFVEHFLRQHHASPSLQISMQLLFTFAEAVFTALTFGDAFDEQWVSNFTDITKQTRLLGGLVVVEGFVALFGYYTIANDSMLVELFGDNHTLQWIFLSLSFVLAIPGALAYSNYVLPRAKDGYNFFTGVLSGIKDKAINAFNGRYSDSFFLPKKDSGKKSSETTHLLSGNSSSVQV